MRKPRQCRVVCVLARDAGSNRPLSIMMLQLLFILSNEWPSSPALFCDSSS